MNRIVKGVLAGAAAAAALAAGSVAQAAERATFSGSFTVALRAQAAQAQHLFDPVGEAIWAPGWAPAFVRETDRTQLPDGTVFTTPGHGGSTMTWVLQRYDRAAHAIAYTVFAPAGAVVTIRIGLRDGASGGSTADVRYDLVATTEEGDAYVRDFAAQFAHYGPHWQSAIDAATAR
ncbi:MAG TPA: hypothetical protein VHT53_13005 [Candidatus Elarobacter sp.]|jgi:hypothetical protein|nr:hypothetical protein [Candidatus Elarobacter sp.]